MLCCFPRQEVGLEQSSQDTNQHWYRLLVLQVAAFTLLHCTTTLAPMTLTFTLESTYILAGLAYVLVASALIMLCLQDHSYKIMPSQNSSKKCFRVLISVVENFY